MQPESQLQQFGYQQELKRALSLSDLLIYGMIFMVPIAPFGIYGVVAQSSNGMVALAYTIGMIGMIFTANSYARMSEEFPIAGSVYAYATRGIGERIGFLTGWAILLDYILVPSLLYIVGGTAMNSFVPSIPVWLWVLLFIVFNTTVNYFGIEMTARANKIVLVLELIILALFLIMGLIAISKGTGGASFSFKAFYDPQVFNMNVVMGATSIAVLSFLGFDAISTLAEETDGGNQVVGKATFLALLLVGALFIVQTWVAAMVVPDYRSFHNPDTAFYDVAYIAGGTGLKVATAVATALAWGIANALVAQAATARVLFSMARDGKMPRFLAKVHPKYKTPYTSTFFVAGISLVVSLFFIAHLAQLTSMVNFGALTAFLALHVSVMVHFIGRKKSKQYGKYLVLPLIGILIIGYVWLSLDSFAKTYGLVWLGIGVLVLLFLKWKGKDVQLD